MANKRKNKKERTWELVGMRRRYSDALDFAHQIAMHDWKMKGSYGGIAYFNGTFKPNYVRVWEEGEEWDDYGSLVKDPDRYLIYVNRKMALG